MMLALEIVLAGLVVLMALAMLLAAARDISQVHATRDERTEVAKAALHEDTTRMQLRLLPPAPAYQDDAGSAEVLFVIAMALFGVTILSVLGVLGYVAAHFISKVW